MTAIAQSINEAVADVMIVQAIDGCQVIGKSPFKVFRALTIRGLPDTSIYCMSCCLDRGHYLTLVRRKH